MFLLEYLFYLGIAWIVFWLVNWLFGLLAGVVLALTKFAKGSYITIAFSLYILVSLTALLTLGFIRMNPGAVSSIALPILGGFLTFMSLSQSAYERKKQAIQDYNYESLQLFKYDGLFVIGFTALFVVMLFVPSIAQNPLTMRLLALIDWAYELKIIGWILRIGGALFLLAFVFQGFLLSVALLAYTKIIREMSRTPCVSPSVISDHFIRVR